jgi:hypothetical protein
VGWLLVNFPWALLVNWIAAAMPGELLTEVGFRSRPADIALTSLVLLGPLSQGIATLAKCARWVRRRLRSARAAKGHARPKAAGTDVS